MKYSLTFLVFALVCFIGHSEAQYDSYGNPCDIDNCAWCNKADKTECQMCKDGFNQDDSTGLCEDIDECAPFGSNNCDANAMCMNVIGTFLCECKNGYVGDGTKCDEQSGDGSGDDGCDMILKSYMHVLGGNPQAGIKDEQECVQSCKDEGDKCHGIDFHIADTPYIGVYCWHHDEPVMGRERNNSKANHYAKDCAGGDGSGD